MVERIAASISPPLSYLVPRDEADAKFREELGRIAVTGLRVIASVSFAGALLWFLVGFVWLPELVRTVGLSCVLAVVLGLAALSLSFWSRTRPRSRTWGLMAVYLLGALGTIGATHVELTAIELVTWIHASFIVVLLVTVAALPVKPFHVLLLSLALTATYVFELREAGFESQPAGVPAMQLVFFAVMIPTAVALTAILYRQRASAFRADRATEQALEELRDARVRVCVSEHAASQGRFAAALSHELNSPLGALTSAFDTVVQVHEREKLQPERRTELEEILQRAVDSGRESTSRLRELVGRMKHVTNLDQAEEGIVDVNELWRDTIALLSEELESKATVRMDLKPLPALKCRPQQLSAVFSNLLRNGAAAMERKGTILVSTEHHGDHILLEVRDSGRGMSREELEGLFDLRFQAGQGRVAVANWGLFMARSIVSEHGGHLEFDSKEGRGTIARVVLPVDKESSPEGCSCSDRQVERGEATINTC